MKPSPKKGQIVLHCGHIFDDRRSDRHHWYQLFEESRRFRRPGDGSIAVADWICVCKECFEGFGSDPLKLKIVGDFVWGDDEPLNWVEK